MFHYGPVPHSEPEPQPSFDNVKYASSVPELLPDGLLTSVQTKSFKRGKSPRKRQKRSLVWLYFRDDEHDENAAVCLICTNSVPRGRNLARNTTNLRKHLEHRHKELFLNRPMANLQHSILPHEVPCRTEDPSRTLEDVLPVTDATNGGGGGGGSGGGSGSGSGTTQLSTQLAYSQPMVVQHQHQQQQHHQQGSSLPHLNGQFGGNVSVGSSQYLGGTQFGATQFASGVTQFGGGNNQFNGGYAMGNQQQMGVQQWQQAYQINGMVQQVQQLQLDVRQGERVGVSEFFVARLEGKREEVELQHGVYSG